MKKVIILVILILISGCSKKETININEDQTNDINNSVYQFEVITDSINIREDATIDSKKIGVINKGEVYTIKDFSFDDNYLWYKIETKNGIQGYIASIYSPMWVKILVPDTIEEKDIALTLKGDEELLVKKDTKFTDPGYEINVSNTKVNVVGDVDITTPGIYNLTYEVSDYYGNKKSLTREVIVYITTNMKQRIDDLEIKLISNKDVLNNQHLINVNLANKGNKLISGAGTINYLDNKEVIDDAFELHVDEAKDININLKNYQEGIKYFIYCLPISTNNTCPPNGGIPFVFE
ncbi:MAG: immunoglobulin-like domain-containing protein [Ignavibacteriales bacterium]